MMTTQRFSKFSQFPVFILAIWIPLCARLLFVSAKDPVRVGLTTRNFSQFRNSNKSINVPLNKTSDESLDSLSVDNSTRNESEVVKVVLPERNNDSVPLSSTGGGGDERAIGRSGKSMFQPSKIHGVDKYSQQHPEELIRKALINHTLEHGGEEDLDKLVFSTLPQGSKLILRTVKIIRTDENGDPIDNAEQTQPTYWDVTLQNATDPVVDEEEDEEDESEEETSSEEEEDEKTSAEEKTGGEVKEGGNGVGVGMVVTEKKKDLDSAGSHASAKYHRLNDYVATDREKERGKEQYHGTDHGITHKKTHTVTDGKKVKPYHGTEKGYTDYANDHGDSQDKKGERYKSSKRKNKGRKVSGFKRVYHKEEFQRTEHFYDAEEANKIAESFGLSEGKAGDNHGTKDDKRKYHGVRTEYLDGKKHKNEHGTSDGYDKGQKTTYKDAEKHLHHRDYGKSSSQSHHSHGSPPSHENSGTYYSRNSQPVYHPNHNYHASYSSPREKAVPTSVADKIGSGGGGGSGGEQPQPSAIVSAPIATSFTVTEYSTGADSASTPDPSVVSVLTNAIRTYPMNRFHNGHHGNVSDPYMELNKTVSYDEEDSEEEDLFEDILSSPPMKEPRERKMFFSPKHRTIKEEDPPEVSSLPKVIKTATLTTNAKPYEAPPKRKLYPVPLPSTNSKQYQPQEQKAPAPLQADTEATEEEEESEESEEEEEREVTQRKPYAPNFGPPPKNPPPRKPPHSLPSSEYQSNPRKGPKSVDWQRMPQKRPPGPSQYQRAVPPEPVEQYQRPVQSDPAVKYERPLKPEPLPNYPSLRTNSEDNPEHLAISLRHAQAYNRLLRHQQGSRDQGPRRLEMSTRKSDIVPEDEDVSEEINDSSENTNKGPGKENDSAHFFNHNQRYAKNHLTSTLSPTKGESSGSSKDGVRNSLIDNSPGLYSTVIKVLPATMISLNETTLQNAFGMRQPPNSITASGSIVSVTRRPKSHNPDMISITTKYPQGHPQHHPAQQHRPFIPNKGRWLSLSFNVGNPDYKLGAEFGPSQHPFRHKSKKVSHLMQGIKHGLLKPFGRGPLLPHHGLLASPTANSGVFHRKVPYVMRPRFLPRHPNNRGPPRIRPHPMVQQYPNPQFRTIGVQHPQQSSSKEQIQAIALPSPPKIQSYTTHRRPKFYYKPTNVTTSNGVLQDDEDDDGGDGEELSMNESSGAYSPSNVQPTSSTSRTTTTTQGVLVSDISSSTETLTPRRQPSHPPPFINSLMDSVANFFGKMG